MPKPIIIDTDPGIDDALAIFLALRSPELEVLGLTTVFGNISVELATTNALRLLEIAQAELPVAQGAAHPLVGRFGGGVPHIHGEDGQGNVFLSEPKAKAVSQSAAEFLVDQVMARPGEITLVPIGPLTNLALALSLEPRIDQAAAGVVLMGGNALEPGNATPAAEANIHCDPEAADAVFGAAWPVTMVGLDVTHQVIMTDQDVDQLTHRSSALAQHIAQIVPFYRNFVHGRSGLEGFHLHDSSAVAYVLHPEWFSTRACAVRVDTSQGCGRGKTWPDWGRADLQNPKLAPWLNRPRAQLCMGVEGRKIVELSLQRL